MDKRRNDDLPHEDQSDIEAEAEKNREEEDRIPPRGSDPLTEGP